MRKIIPTLILLYCYILYGCTTNSVSGVNPHTIRENRVLQDGMHIRISYFNYSEPEPYFVCNNILRDRGQAYFPIIGNLRLEGLTTTEAALFIQKRYEMEFNMPSPMTVSILDGKEIEGVTYWYVGGIPTTMKKK